MTRPTRKEPKRKRQTRGHTPKALLESDQKTQEMEALAGRGVHHKGGMVVVLDRAKKSTLTKLLGMNAMVVGVMPQDQLVKIVRQNTNKGRRKKKNLKRGEMGQDSKGPSPRAHHKPVKCYRDKEAPIASEAIYIHTPMGRAGHCPRNRWCSNEEQQ